MLAGRRNMIGYKTIPRQQLENILTNLSASTATPKAATRPKPCTPTPVPRPKKHTPDLKMCTSICHKNCTPKFNSHAKSTATPVYSKIMHHSLTASAK